MIGPFKGEYEFLSNFSRSELIYEGLIYPTVEHAFQAAKTTDPEQRKQIAYIPWNAPGLAKRAGRRLELRPDWESIKIDIMRQLLFKKFHSPILRKKLLDTGDEELVEVNTWNDRYWGVCNKVGENHLGILLMEVRKTLREEQQAFNLSKQLT